jgi:hypothetical protein
MKKSRILVVCLIGVLLVCGMVLMGCSDNNCPRRDADCRIGNACGNYVNYEKNTCLMFSGEEGDRGTCDC